MPQSDDLHAFWDRLPLRYVVSYLSEAGFARFLRLGDPPPVGVRLSLPDLEALQAAARGVDIPDSLAQALERLRRDLLAEGITVSDRRWGIALGLLKAHALIEGRVAAEEDDLAILAHVCWQQPDQAARIARAAGRLANPLNQRATEIGDEAKSVYDALLAKQADPTASGDDKTQVQVETLTKLKEHRRQITTVYTQAKAEGRSLAKIEQIGKAVAAWQMAVAEMLTS
jgi:MoxR-like ATPase